MTDSNTTEARSYGCTFACGNPYDFVVIDIRSGTTEFVCLPCFVRLAGDLVAAVTETNNPALAAALAYDAGNPVAQAPGPTGKRRGKNAPVTTIDPDLFDVFDAAMPDDVDAMDGD